MTHYRASAITHEDGELSIVVVLDTPDGGEDVHRFLTLTEADKAGYPIGCQWFAGCSGDAAEMVEHPILVAVPTCAKHAAWVEDNR